MGFYYLLLLVLGIALLVIGFKKKDVSYSVKFVILLFVLGILFIFISILLLQPGSSEWIAQLLDI